MVLQMYYTFLYIVAITSQFKDGRDVKLFILITILLNRYEIS